jgi:hypothetical protein
MDMHSFSFKVTSALDFTNSFLFPLIKHILAYILAFSSVHETAKGG